MRLLTLSVLTLFFSTSALASGFVVARFGGDEFMILLPDTDQSGAVGVAHKLREAISRITISSLSERLSCSFGVAQVSKNEHIMVTIDRADRALLQAKRNGRDRIEKDAV